LRVLRRAQPMKLRPAGRACRELRASLPTIGVPGAKAPAQTIPRDDKGLVLRNVQNSKLWRRTRLAPTRPAVTGPARCLPGKSEKKRTGRVMGGGRPSGRAVLYRWPLRHPPLCQPNRQRHRRQIERRTRDVPRHHAHRVVRLHDCIELDEPRRRHQRSLRQIARPCAVHRDFDQRRRPLGRYEDTPAGSSRRLEANRNLVSDRFGLNSLRD
jgi:hypothetical protein